jgi:hypothetical protein
MSKKPDLTNHYRSPYLLPVPHWRTYLPGIFRSCNFFVRSMNLCPRRIAFLLNFLMRTLEAAYFSAISLTGSWNDYGVWLLVFVIFTAFTIELWNLHLIVEAEGDGMVWGRRIPAGAFTLFMLWNTVAHVVLVVLEITGMMFYVFEDGTFNIEGTLIAVTVLLAWVANRDVVDGGMSLA